MKKMIFMFITFVFLLMNSGCARSEPIPGEKLSDNQIINLFSKEKILFKEKKYQEIINLLEPYAEKNAYTVVVQDGKRFFIANPLGFAYFRVKDYVKAVPYVDFFYADYLENHDKIMNIDNTSVYFQITRERAIKAGANIESFCEVYNKKRIGCIETGDSQYVDIKELADAISADFRSTSAGNWNISFKGKTAKLSTETGSNSIPAIIEKEKAYASAIEIAESLGGKATWYEQSKWLVIGIY